ncbi:Txe/YoeB family addiction module toxin [Parapedobacter koreensis]|uniref:Putative mRNA interferase YoeB n=1 Tax=Parapedobacter koreensis TaxID=332977 RepID=A0A1H7JU74_9SPHI|nr:Txe/YoeB family addiction module toxin [Parapedobacter koreensis]SEK78188.1 toxin YoeB [Parapedobacter koreensis]
MEIDYSEQAMADIACWKKSGNLAIQKKISRLISSIQENPYNGIGKPEALKYELSGKWSRRITDEHRIVYEVLNDRIRIHSVKGHYWK